MYVLNTHTKITHAYTYYAYTHITYITYTHAHTHNTLSHTQFHFVISQIMVRTQCITHPMQQRQSGRQIEYPFYARGVKGVRVLQLLFEYSDESLGTHCCASSMCITVVYLCMCVSLCMYVMYVYVCRTVCVCMNICVCVCVCVCVCACVCVFQIFF